MSYVVRIRNNETKEVRTSRVFDLKWEEHSDYWWLEGNMGCDCNRELEWMRAGGGDPEVGSTECGEGRFTVIDATLDDGTVIVLQGES